MSWPLQKSTGRTAQHLADVGALAYQASAGNVSTSASAITVGVRFFCTDARSCRGVRFFWKLSGSSPSPVSGYAETVIVSLWDASGTKLATTTVAVGLPVGGGGCGQSVALVALFSSAKSLTKEARYTVSMAGSSAHAYPYATSATLNTSPLLLSPLLSMPIDRGDGCIIEAERYGTGTDAFPVTSTSPSAEAHFIEPVLDGEHYTETPIVAASSLLLCDGNSICAGTVGTTENQSYPHLVATALGRPYVNLGAPGYKIDDLTARFATYPAIYAGAELIGEGCYNDFAASGRTGAQAYTNLQAYVAAARSAGFTRVAWLTQYLTTGSAAAYNTQETAFNTLVRANSGSLLDLVIDVAAGPAVSLQGDGVHPDASGQATIAGVVEAALTSAGW
jgi:hypothetical protein